MTAIVKTERLLVRPWRVEDAEDAFAIYGDPEVTAFLPDDVRDATVAETRAWLERKVAEGRDGEPLGHWALVERASGRVIGHALLQRAPINGADRVELGYALICAAWGKGYATEVAQGLLRYGFDVLRLDEIYGVVIPENVASRRVLEKIGMRSLGMGDYGGFPVEVLVIAARSQGSLLASLIEGQP